MAVDKPNIGCVRGVVVLPGSDGEAAAVVQVRVSPAISQRGGTRMKGPVRLTVPSARHLTDVVLPLVGHIITALGLRPKPLDLAISNPAVAGMCGLGLQVDGFSADAPVFLAALSAMLHLDIASDLVVTGHVASTDGLLVPVAALREKLQACLADPSVRQVLCPSLDQDPHLAAQMPAAYAVARDAILLAQGRLRVLEVHNVAELVAAILTRESTLHAGLQASLWGAPPAPTGHMCVDQITAKLTSLGEAEFWAAQNDLRVAGRHREASSLLDAYLGHHCRRGHYPPQAGRCLLAVMATLPGNLRQIGLPLGNLSLARRLATLPGIDEADFVTLLETMRTGHGPTAVSSKAVAQSAAPALASRRDRLRSILGQIGTAARTQVVKPADDARGSYATPTSTVLDHSSFVDAVTRFYVHLMMHVEHASATGPIHIMQACALELVAKAFRREAPRRPVAYASREAREGIQGGLHLVFDRMTEQYKADATERWIHSVFGTATDPAKPEDEAELVRAVLEDSGHPEVSSALAERWGHDCEAIVRAWSQAREDMAATIRRL